MPKANELSIFITGNVPSSKNSKQWTGKFLVMSNVCKRYIKATEWEYASNKRIFAEMIKHKEPPYKVSLTFTRDSRRRFDYINAAQIVLDLMVKHEWITDDNADVVIAVFEPYKHDPKYAGVEIKVI